MKIYLVCMECLFSGTNSSKWYPEKANEDGVYSFTCDNGHKVSTVYQTFKHEMLFETGATAFLDGYNREAVTSFSAAYERALEFYIRTVSKKRKIPDADVAKAWADVAAQSERQLGWFIGLYMAENQRAPKLTVEGMKKERNRATHKGIVPDDEEVLKYGQTVMDFILDLYDELRGTGSEVLEAMVTEMMKQKHQKVPEGYKASTMAGTIISTTTMGNPRLSLVDQLKHHENMRKMYATTPEVLALTPADEEV